MIILYILLCAVSVILITLVLMQDSKSGLGGLTGGSTMSSFGANTDKFLIKLTGGAGAAFFLLVIFIHIGKRNETDAKSLLPAATKKADTSTVTVPTVDLGEDKKSDAATNEKASENTDPTKESTEPKGESVVIPLKDVKEAPAPEPKAETPETPKEVEK